MSVCEEHKGRSFSVILFVLFFPSFVLGREFSRFQLPEHSDKDFIPGNHLKCLSLLCDLGREHPPVVTNIIKKKLQSHTFYTKTIKQVVWTVEPTENITQICSPLWLCRALCFQLILQLYWFGSLSSLSQRCFQPQQTALFIKKALEAHWSALKRSKTHLAINWWTQRRI